MLYQLWDPKRSVDIDVTYWDSQAPLLMDMSTAAPVVSAGSTSDIDRMNLIIFAFST